MSFVTEALLISGVALDLVGATVLSHAHTVESTLELREEISGDERALGEKDAIATHARLLSEKRVGFLILSFGLALYLAGLVVGTSESFVGMALFAVGVLALGLGVAALWTKVGTRRVSRQTHEATRSEDAEISDQ
ncbi:MAG: hypothetical protein LC714_04410 [Actinobacteria bacterium]|nr:hypothetical protein [Actinomycetota bacterium]